MTALIILLIIFVVLMGLLVVYFMIDMGTIKKFKKTATDNKEPTYINFDETTTVDDLKSIEMDKIYDTYMEITTTLSTIKEIDLLKSKSAELPTEFSNNYKIGEDYNCSETLDIQRDKYVQQLRVQYQIFVSEFAKIEYTATKSLKQICYELIDSCSEYLKVDDDICVS